MIVSPYTSVTTWELWRLLAEFVWSMLRIPLLLMMLLIVLAIRDTVDVCGDEFGLSDPSYGS